MRKIWIANGSLYLLGQDATKCKPKLNSWIQDQQPTVGATFKVKNVTHEIWHQSNTLIAPGLCSLVGAHASFWGYDWRPEWKQLDIARTRRVAKNVTSSEHERCSEPAPKDSGYMCGRLNKTKYPKFCIGFKIRKSRCKQFLLSGSGHSKWFSSAALQGVMWDWVEQ